MQDPSSETQDLLKLRSRTDRQQLFAKIFEHQRSRLRRMVNLRIDKALKRRVDPSDVLQEAFLEAAKRLDEYLKSPDVPLYIWLRFLTGRKLTDLHRQHLGAKMRDARREVPFSKLAGPQATSEALAAGFLKSQAPSDRVVKAERSALVREALDSMDPVDREVLALRYFESLSNKEAAQILAISEPAVRQRQVRAMRRLKEILSHLGEDFGEADS